MSKRPMNHQITISPEDFNAAIENYIKTPDFDYSILITGEWGTGKTYYFKNNLIDSTGSINNTNAALILISAGGLTTTTEVKENIGIELLSKYGRNRFLNNTKIDLILANDISSFLPESGRKAFTVAQKGIRGLRLYSQYKIQNCLSDRLTLVIDDIERYEGQLSSLLAFIHNRYVNNGIHVVYIANEKEIKDGKYKQNKEKYIRYTFSFHASIRDVLGNLIANRNKGAFFEMFASKHEQIANWISDMGIFNLRIIILAIDCYDFIAGGYTEEDKEYLFKLILLHVDFITHYAGEHEKEKEEYDEYLKSKGLNTAFIYKDYFIEDKTEFPYQRAISTFIHSGYISPIEKEKMLHWLFPVHNEYCRALISLRYSDMMEMDELLEKVSLVLSGVDQMQIPYERLPTAANWLEGICFYLDKEITGMNYKERIIAAIKASDYPKKDHFLLEKKIPRYWYQNDHMPFTQEVYNLLAEEYCKFHEERRQHDFVVAFTTSNTLPYYEAYKDFKGEIFPMICKCKLLPKLKDLNNCGIYNLNVEQYNLNGKVKDQFEYIQKIITQFEEDLNIQDYDKYARRKRVAIIDSLKHKLEYE